MSPLGGAALVLLHGVVWTPDAGEPDAEAIAIAGGEIAWVGDDAGAAEWITANTEVIDLGGRTVIPGFVDGHVHPAAGGVELGQCALGDLSSPTALSAAAEAGSGQSASASSSSLDDAGQLLAAIRSCAATGRGWVIGGGWELTAFPDGRPPAGALDAAVPDRPACLWSADGHSAWVNRRALARARIDRHTPDPPGGRIERDEAGEPTGLLRESAMDLVTPPEPSAHEWRAGLRRALEQANAFGITTLFEADASSRRGLRAYRALDRRGELTARVTLALHVDETRGPEQVRELERLRRRFSSARVRPLAAKIFVDGVIETHTAALLEPYADGAGHGSGDPLWTPAALDAMVLALGAAGFDVHFHAIGDRAVRMALDSAAGARAAGASGRFGIAHLELVDPADRPRFAALGVSAVFQPLWAWADPYVTDLTVPVLGPERSEALYPIGALAAAGAPLAFGSDWTVSSLDPLDGLEVALTRRDPDGDGAGPRLGTDPPLGLGLAFAAYTAGAASASGWDTGVIRVGAPADLAVLDRDPRAVDPGALGELTVWLTVMGGAVVHGPTSR